MTEPHADEQAPGDDRLERRLRDALHAIGDHATPNPDLFGRVTRSVEEDRARRRWRLRVGAAIAAYVLTVAAVLVTAAHTEKGRTVVDWWVIELLTNVVLVTIVAVLGPFIKRFGRSYAADVFRANPRTGKSYLVLTDVAYYLVFLAFILATVSFEADFGWRSRPAEQWEHEVGRVAGMVLLLGILHGLNVVGLPVIGRLLSLNKRLDDGEPVLGDTGQRRSRSDAGRAGSGGGTALPSGGAWVLRIEPAASGPAAPAGPSSSGGRSDVPSDWAPTPGTDDPPASPAAR